MNPNNLKPALTHNAPPKPIESAIQVPTVGAMMAEKYCKDWAKETKVAPYSGGTVFISSSKNTKSKPAWKSPAMPAYRMMRFTCGVAAVNAG